jgi:hypothetical protein
LQCEVYYALTEQDDLKDSDCPEYPTTKYQLPLNFPAESNLGRRHPVFSHGQQAAIASHKLVNEAHILLFDYHIQTIIQENGIIFDGNFSFDYNRDSKHSNKVYFSDKTGATLWDHIRLLNWPICSHTTTSLEIVKRKCTLSSLYDVIVPLDTQTSIYMPTTPSVVRQCKTCKTDYHLYLMQDGFTNVMDYRVKLHIRRYLGQGRAPTDEFWSNGAFEKDMYDAKDITRLSLWRRVAMAIMGK